MNRYGIISAIFMITATSCAGSFLHAKRQCENMERPAGLSLEECIEDMQEPIGSMCLEDFSDYNSYEQCLAANDPNPNYRACSGTLPDWQKFKACVQDPIAYKCAKETAATGGSVYECRRLYEQRESLARQERAIRDLQIQSAEQARQNNLQNLTNTLNNINTTNKINQIQQNQRAPNQGIPLRNDSGPVRVNQPSR